MSSTARKLAVVWGLAAICLLVAYAAHDRGASGDRPHAVSSSLFTSTGPSDAAAPARAQNARDASQVCRPDALQVNSIGIRGTSIIPMRSNDQGMLEPPHGRVVWDEDSALPGRAGVSLLAGHDEFYTPDVFWQLNKVQVGARVSIRCAGGDIQHWRVTTTASLAKKSLGDYLAPTWHGRQPLLALVTCDPNSPVLDLHHTSNYVVLAKPEP